MMITTQRILLWHHLKLLEGYNLPFDPDGNLTFSIEADPKSGVMVAGPLFLNRTDFGYVEIPGEVVEQILLPRLDYLNPLILPSYVPDFAPEHDIAFYYLFALNSLIMDIRAECSRSGG